MHKKSLTYIVVCQLQLEYRNSLKYRKIWLPRLFPVFGSGSVLSTKYANINHFRLFFWNFCYTISLFWAFFLEFFGLGNNLALKAPHYTRTTTLILCITFHFWVRMSFFENAGGFAGTPSLAVGLFYTCILQGAR